MEKSAFEATRRQFVKLVAAAVAPVPALSSVVHAETQRGRQKQIVSSIDYPRRFSGEYLSRIAFPVGGIGTGVDRCCLTIREIVDGVLRLCSFFPKGNRSPPRTELLKRTEGYMDQESRLHKSSSALTHCPQAASDRHSARRGGLSLNHFIVLAIAEKLVRMEKGRDSEREDWQL